MNSVLNFIAKISDLVVIAVQVGQDVIPLVEKIKAAAMKGPDWKPTDADWAALDDLEQSLRDELNANQEGDS